MKKIVLPLFVALIAGLGACSNSGSPVAEVCDIMNEMATRIDELSPDQEIDAATEAYFTQSGNTLDSIRKANADLKLSAEDKAALKEAANRMGAAVIRQQAKAVGIDMDSEEMRELMVQTEQATNQSIDNMETLGEAAKAM